MLIVAYCLIVIGYTWDLTLTPGKYIWPYLYVLFWSILAWLLHVNVVTWLLHVNVVTWLLHVKLQVRRAQRWCSILNHCHLRKHIVLDHDQSWPITSKNPTIISYSSGEFHQHSNKSHGVQLTFLFSDCSFWTTPSRKPVISPTLTGTEPRPFVKSLVALCTSDTSLSITFWAARNFLLRISYGTWI